MLGDVIKEFVDRMLDCQDCGRAVEIPTKGICCDQCGKNIRWNDELKSDYDELLAAAKERDELKDIIEKHKLNIMPLEIENLQQSLKWETRNVLDLSRRINDNAKYTELGKAFEWAIKTNFDFVWNGDMDEDYPVDEEDKKALLRAFRNKVTNLKETEGK